MSGARVARARHDMTGSGESACGALPVAATTLCASAARSTGRPPSSRRSRMWPVIDSARGDIVLAEAVAATRSRLCTVSPRMLDGHGKRLLELVEDLPA